jgi:hypothetical protein
MDDLGELAGIDGFGQPARRLGIQVAVCYQEQARAQRRHRGWWDRRLHAVSESGNPGGVNASLVDGLHMRDAGQSCLGLRQGSQSKGFCKGQPHQAVAALGYEKFRRLRRQGANHEDRVG